MINDHKITCVCVTKDRPKEVKNSIRNYINQTYTNKEFLIVSQGTSQTNRNIKRYIDSLNRSDIFFMEASPELSLGMLRKLSSYEASGDIVCQWDDDDIYHPKRLSTQYSSLIENNAILSLYESHLHYSLNSKELYYVDWSVEIGEDYDRCLCGSVMFFKKLGNQYLGIIDNYVDLNTQEDLEFVKLSFIEYPYVLIPQGYQYIYVYHGFNTTSEFHHQILLNSKYVYSKEEIFAISKHIRQYNNLSVVKINVMGSDGIAFTM